MKKRTVALVFVALVLVPVGATLLALRTRWAGEWICALAAAKVERATGLPLAVDSCRIAPLALEVEVRGVRLGPAAAPMFTADAVEARLTPVQVLGRKLHLESLRLVRPRVVATIPPGRGGGAGTCPPPLLSQFQIRHLEVEGGALDLAFPGGERVAVDRLDVSSRPTATRRSLRVLAAAVRRTHLAVRAEGIRVEAAGRTLRARTAGAEGDVALDLSSAEVAHADAEVEGVRLGLEGRIRDLCSPRLDLVASAEGDVAALLALAGRPASEISGTARVEARLAGPSRSLDVNGALRFRGVRAGAFVPGDGEAEVHLEPDRLVVKRLEVRAAGGSAVVRGSMRLGRGLPVEADVEVRDVDLAEILARLGVTGSWVTVRLDGKAHVAGPLWPPQLAGTLSTDVRDFRALTRSWELAPASEPGIVEFRRGHVETAVRVDRDALTLEHARVTVGRGGVDADASIRFRSAGGFQVRCRGDVDVSALGHIASVPWSGRAAVEATIAAAPYGNPRIEGRLRTEGFHFLHVDLANAVADFSYDRDFRLHLTGVEGVRGGSRYRGDATIDLAASPPRVVSSRFAAQGRLRDLFDAVMEWLPRTRYVREAMDGDVEVSGTAAGPADALDADFDARLGTGEVWGRRFESGRAVGKIVAGEEVQFERAELRRGSGVARARGRWGFAVPFPWGLDVTFAGVPIAELDLPGGPWSGSAAGNATLRGSYAHPQIAFAGTGDGVTVRGAALGSVQAGGTLNERRLVVTGGADGLEFAGEARLEGRMPFRASAQLAVDDLERLLPSGAGAALKARVAGEVTAEGELAEVEAARASIRLDQLSLGYGDLRVESQAPVLASVNRQRIDVQPFTLRGTNTELTVAGARLPSGQLDLSASGDVDLRLLAGLVPTLKRPHGLLALEAHVGGTAEEPVLVGAGRIADAGFELRGATIAFSAIRGELAFSQNRVLFDGLSAAVNGGRAALRGDLELSRFAPVRGRVEADLDEVPVAIPAYLPVTLSGRVEAAGTPEAAAVTGRLHVVRARYAVNVDLEKGLLELRRRPAPPPRAYDRAGEWLRFDVQLVVDGDARVENDLVRGGVRGELTLTGTLAAPGLVGTLSMTEASRALFRGNEFILTQAVLNFTDRHAIDIDLDVHGESQVRDYQIYMHLFGSLATPQLQLTSSPALSQPDIITLLSLGFTSRDAAANAGVGGVATAAAAQALFSASGLEEQVKRFLPRGGVMRDLSVRITSVYSEGTGQVEPRAEFESWLLRDRLRLRYQAPLAGARGQKAQAEVRLGDHTAVQYQWDTDNPDVAATGDHGVDLKLRWEWSD